MKDFVISHKLYGAWEYEKEVEDLNLSSSNGLQLVKGGCFHSKFKRDQSVRYVYQLDYNPGIVDKPRYFEMFEEQGWVYINSTFNGWHYFKKEFSDTLSADDMVIYSDRASLYEMQNRWIRLIAILSIFYPFMAVMYLSMGISQQEMSLFLEGIVFTLFSITFLLAFINVKRKRAGKEGIINIPLQIVFPFILILLVASIILLYL